MIKLTEYVFNKVNVEWRWPPGMEGEQLKIERYQRGFGFKEYFSKKKGKDYRMDLDLRIEQFSRDMPAAFLIDISMIGVFELEKNISDYTAGEEINVQTQAVDILYGIISGHVSVLTASFPAGKYIFSKLSIEDLKDIVQRHNDVLKKAEASKESASKKTLQPATT